MFSHVIGPVFGSLTDVIFAKVIGTHVRMNLPLSLSLSLLLSRLYTCLLHTLFIYLTRYLGCFHWFGSGSIGSSPHEYARWSIGNNRWSTQFKTEGTAERYEEVQPIYRPNQPTVGKICESNRKETAPHQPLRSLVICIYSIHQQLFISLPFMNSILYIGSIGRGENEKPQ